MRPSRISSITLRPRARELRLAKAMQAVHPVSGTCSTHPRREGDELVCICGRRWPVNEERPCDV